MISTLTNAAFLALGQREKLGQVKIRCFKPLLGMAGGYEVDWDELPAPTPPTPSQTPAQGVPVANQPVMVPCDDCEAEHPIDEPCRICAALARAMIANRKLRRDRQLDRQFKKGVDV